MSRVWSDFLDGATPCAHGVQVYDEIGELASSVASFLVVGFAAGEPALVVASAEHRAAFMAELHARGCPAGTLEQEGLLTVLDAEETLAAFTEGSRVSPVLFEETIGGAVDAITARLPGRGLRVFGEMVDVLVRRGHVQAAIALEELWNDLARTRRFTLLCGYRMDIFDRETQVSQLPEICRLHSHVLPTPDVALLEASVDRALEEVVGARDAGRIYALVASDARARRIPAAQLALMWVSTHMPALADRILASARANYRSAPAPSSG